MGTSKKSRLAQPPKQEYRIALKSSSKMFVLNSQVICQLPNNENTVLEFYSGKITSIFDNFVRVHFFGMSSKEDLWLERTCSYLWMNVGIPDQNEIYLLEEENKERLNRHNKTVMKDGEVVARIDKIWRKGLKSKNKKIRAMI